MFEKKKLRGAYILHAMHDISLNGDAYASSEDLYRACQKNNRQLTYFAFRSDLLYLLHEERLHLEGQRLYTAYRWRCEQSAAASLSKILRSPYLDKPELPDSLEVNGIPLTEEQHSAVKVALSSRLSLILGGAGTGKTTLIQSIVDFHSGPAILCAPTGKAARNPHYPDRPHSTHCPQRTWSASKRRLS